MKGKKLNSKKKKIKFVNAKINSDARKNLNFKTENRGKIN